MTADIGAKEKQGESNFSDSPCIECRVHPFVNVTCLLRQARSVHPTSIRRKEQLRNRSLEQQLRIRSLELRCNRCRIRRHRS